jgi:outer membrane immunogenic protein
MKTLLCSAAIVALSVGAAAASGPEVVVVPVIEPVAVGTDWSGVYFGGFIGMSRGPMYDIGGPYNLTNDASAAGFMLGYRGDFGSFVGGVELASTAGINMQQVGFPGWRFLSMTDARVMAGYEFGNALVFGSAGATHSTFTDGGTIYNYNGWNAGIGVDYLISDNAFIGAEIVHRDLKRTDLTTWTGVFNSLQIRGGIIF